MENQAQAWFSSRRRGNLKHTTNKNEKSLSLQRLDVKACGQGKLQELWGNSQMLLRSIIL